MLGAFVVKGVAARGACDSCPGGDVSHTTGGAGGGEGGEVEEMYRIWLSYAIRELEFWLLLDLLNSFPQFFKKKQFL
jgi:hypothetical protein